MWLLERRATTSAHLDTHTFTQWRALCDLERPPSQRHTWWTLGAVANSVAGSSFKGQVVKISKYSQYFCLKMLNVFCKVVGFFVFFARAAKREKESRVDNVDKHNPMTKHRSTNAPGER